jgi:hypothetical protein
VIVDLLLPVLGMNCRRGKEYYKTKKNKLFHVRCAFGALRC